jgi:hypothetical protein
MNIDLGLIRSSLDFDARNACMIEPALEKLLHPKVFVKQFRIIVPRKPLRIPRLDYAKTK